MHTPAVVQLAPAATGVCCLATLRCQEAVTLGLRRTLSKPHALSFQGIPRVKSLPWVAGSIGLGWLEPARDIGFFLARPDPTHEISKTACDPTLPGPGYLELLLYNPTRGSDHEP